MAKQVWIVLLLILSLTSITYAQEPNYYLFEQKSTNYTELVNDTAIPGAFSNPTGVWMFDLAGDNFSFFGKPYPIDNVKKHIVFSNNGFMRIEDDSTFIVVDAAFAYSDSIDADSKLSYIVEGTPGNRIVKVQWKNLKLTSGATGNFVNYQIWLYQKTGVFEIYYGPSSANNQSGYTIANGPNIGLFYSLKTFTKMFEKIWINGTPGSYTTDSAKNVVFNAAAGIPVSGTMLRFIPKKVAAGIRPIHLHHIAETFPNPANNNINIKLQQAFNTPADVSLYDITGKKVESCKLHAGQLSQVISVHNIPAGIYTLKLENDSNVYTQVIEIAK